MSFMSSSRNAESLLFVLVHEEPAMSFQIFRAIPPAGWSRFDIRQNRRTGTLRTGEVLLDVVHIDKYAIDDPGHRRPLARLLACLAMTFGTAVFGCRRGKHDQSVTCHHFAVREPPVRLDITGDFPESECAVQPFQGGHT